MKLVLAFLCAVVLMAVLASPAALAKCSNEAPYYFGRGEPGSALASLFLFPPSLAIGVATFGASVPTPRGAQPRGRAICMPGLLAGHVVAWRSVEARAQIERGLQ